MTDNLPRIHHSRLSIKKYINNYHRFNSSLAQLQKEGDLTNISHLKLLK